jgi:dihydroorotate dehydrogenase
VVRFRGLSVYKWAARPLLFSLDPERAHELILSALQRPLLVSALGLTVAAPDSDERLRQRVLGLPFENPLGVAAGLDKQGTAVGAWAALGFGHAEIGTVTPRPQPGNPRPRMFRLTADAALINRLGFNSLGALEVAGNLAAVSGRTIQIGVNVGKNRLTPLERAVDDYVRAVEALHRYADYFTVNVSSPNTEGLRTLQEAATLRSLVEQVVAHVRSVAGTRSIPVLAKFSPDAPLPDLLASVDAALEAGASGIIATNTTVSRADLASPDALTAETGGLSGAPLRSAADRTCQQLFRHIGRRAPIIGVGGIFTADDAYQRIRSGATLVQMYTGLIYEGPGAAARILRGLNARLQRDGFASVADAVGANVS